MSQAVTGFVSAICPWLILILCLQRIARWRGWPWRGRVLLWVPAATALVILLLPINGVMIARWMAGISANFSIPFTCLLAVAAYERAFATPVSSAKDWIAGWSFGAAGGLALYPLALGLSGF